MPSFQPREEVFESDRKCNAKGWNDILMKMILRNGGFKTEELLDRKNMQIHKIKNG